MFKGSLQDLLSNKKVMMKNMESGEQKSVTAVIHYFEKYSLKEIKFMKVQRLMMIGIFILPALLGLLTSCKYDVAEPMWDKPFTSPAAPAITQIDPSPVAKAGANTITIHGQNLVIGSDTTVVYFNNVRAEVKSISSTEIVVYRPNLVMQSGEIKVAPNKALVEAKYTPYNIDQVVEKYGNFLDNLPLAAVVADKSENLYVVESTARTIWKVTPDGQKTSLGTASRAPLDAKIGPDGNIYMTGNNRSIDKFDMQTGKAATWLQLAAGKLPKVCDFDANGNFYAAGTKSDLIIIAPDKTVKYANLYAKDDIQAIKISNGYIYLFVKTATPDANTPALAVFRHSIGSDGQLGAKELVFDWTATPFVDRSVKALTISSDGKIYLATDSKDPILIADPVSNTVDYLYKGILPSNCKQFCWGAGTNIYMISGDTQLSVNWTVYKVDTGIKSGISF